MASSEVYDFVTEVVPDYNAAIGIEPQGEILEESAKSQVIHIGVDGSEERISFTTTSIFYITIHWNVLSESNAGTIFNWYNDPVKANGIQRSFKYTWGDGHTYVVRFDSKLPRRGQALSRYGFSDIRLKILGRIGEPSSSASPSTSPSVSPSLSPSASASPSVSPSLSPSASASPSVSPSLSPSESPSASPSTP